MPSPKHRKIDKKSTGLSVVGISNGETAMSLKLHRYTTGCMFVAFVCGSFQYNGDGFIAVSHFGTP